MRVLARLRERLLVGGDRGVGLLLQPRRLGKVAGDAVVAGSSRIAPIRGSATRLIRSRAPPKQISEPEELRSEGGRVEGREGAVLAAAMRLRRVTSRRGLRRGPAPRGGSRLR